MCVRSAGLDASLAAHELSLVLLLLPTALSECSPSDILADPAASISINQRLTILPGVKEQETSPAKTVQSPTPVVRRD